MNLMLQRDYHPCAVAHDLSNTVQMRPWELAINGAAAQIDKHLLNTIFTKYGFVKHCDALKRYLLLGQGDFIHTLMDLIGSDLSKSAAEMSEYQLNGSLDAAIRASNAQFDDADILDRLRVKLAKGTNMETGGLLSHTMCFSVQTAASPEQNRQSKIIRAKSPDELT